MTTRLSSGRRRVAGFPELCRAGAAVGADKRVFRHLGLYAVYALRLDIFWAAAAATRLKDLGELEKEGELYAALCPELDVASQGATVEEATSNLREAVELFLECADPEEVKRRLRTDVFVTRIEARHG
jgi:predicted RNase H-like HicB family nuclease